jgi:membrane protein YqaA with SNARE-associated domain
MHRIYHRLIALSATPLAPLWLFVIAFAEASFFPVPPDALLIPMILARPRHAWYLAGICTLGSVLGGLLGYWIGAQFLAQIALPLLHLYHAEPAFHRFVTSFQQYGFWLILAKGLTPIPFKLVTIAAGGARINLATFVLACLLTRGGRFYLIEAIPLRIYGDRARVFIDRRLGLISLAVLALMILAVVALRYL